MKPSTHSRRTFLRRMAAMAGAVAGAGVLKAQDAWAGFEPAMAEYDAMKVAFREILKREYVESLANRSRKLGITTLRSNFLHIADYWDE